MKFGLQRSRCRQGSRWERVGGASTAQAAATTLVPFFCLLLILPPCWDVGSRPVHSFPFCRSRQQQGIPQGNHNKAAHPSSLPSPVRPAINVLQLTRRPSKPAPISTPATSLSSALHQPVLLSLCEFGADVDVLRADAKASAPACDAPGGAARAAATSVSTAQRQQRQGRRAVLAAAAQLQLACRHGTRTSQQQLACRHGRGTPQQQLLQAQTPLNPQGLPPAPSPATTPHMPPILRPATPSGAPPKPQPAGEQLECG